MKQDVLDVLIYLFENYNGADISSDSETLKVELSAAGFPDGDINEALMWLEGLAALQETPQPQALRPGPALRIYTDHEADKLGLRGRGFLLYLEQAGVLDPVQRELVIDRVMALEMEELDLEQLKWVVLMVLFNRSDQALPWMEDWITDAIPGKLH